MNILDNRSEWEAEFNANWLAHFEATGETNWKIYNRPNNAEAPAGKAVDLAQSRLVLISSAGGYVPGASPPFDAENDLGDYTIRLIPSPTSLNEIAYAHTHYDHTAVNADPQVLVPTHHLYQMVEAGDIGELAPFTVSFMGYQPNIARTVDETVPAVVAAALAMQAEAALLVPS